MELNHDEEQRWTVPEKALERFRRGMEMEEKGGRTIEKYLHDVTMFLEYMAPRSAFGKKDVIAYKAWLAERYAVRSANSMLTALNRFLVFLGAGACAVKQFRLQTQTFCDQRKELSREEYGRLLEEAWRQGKIQLYYILQTLCATGIRVGELPAVTVEAAMQGSAVARNKGKTRVILLPAALCEMLLEYARGCGVESGPVFVTRSGKPVDRSNIWRGMRRLCQQSGVQPEKVFPHNLRHLFARTFYQQEKDLTHLADILGHQSVNTTRIYIASSGEEHRAQIESLGLAVPIAHLPICEQHNVILCC